jgi:hypothetical protein
MSVFFKNKMSAMGLKKSVMVDTLMTARFLISFFFCLLDNGGPAMPDSDDADPPTEAVSDTDDASVASLHDQRSLSAGQAVEAASSPKSM